MAVCEALREAFAAAHPGDGRTRLSFDRGGRAPTSATVAECRRACWPGSGWRDGRPLSSVDHGSPRRSEPDRGELSAADVRGRFRRGLACDWSSRATDAKRRARSNPRGLPAGGRGAASAAGWRLARHQGTDRRGVFRDCGAAGLVAGVAVAGEALEAYVHHWYGHVRGAALCGRGVGGPGRCPPAAKVPPPAAGRDARPGRWRPLAAWNTGISKA